MADKLSSQNIRVDIDDRNESIGKRIRDAERDWIRYTLVIGEKEANSENLSIRDRQTGNVRELTFDDFINENYGGEVVFIDAGYHVKVNEKDYMGVWSGDDIEVIGNIFQLPCNPDHNGECLVCDCWLSDCPFLKFKE